ncbi:hypothetical protein DICA3_E07294 [Diutina catenulata]
MRASIIVSSLLAVVCGAPVVIDGAMYTAPNAGRSDRELRQLRDANHHQRYVRNIVHVDHYPLPWPTKSNEAEVVDTFNHASKRDFAESELVHPSEMVIA